MVQWTAAPPTYKALVATRENARPTEFSEKACEEWDCNAAASWYMLYIADLDGIYWPFQDLPSDIMCTFAKLHDTVLAKFGEK